LLLPSDERKASKQTTNQRAGEECRGDENFSVEYVLLRKLFIFPEKTIEKRTEKKQIFHQKARKSFVFFFCVDINFLCHQFFGLNVEKARGK